MNKKIMTILLIFTLLTVGICAVSAGDVADDTATGDVDVASTSYDTSAGDIDDASEDTGEDTSTDESNDENVTSENEESAIPDVKDVSSNPTTTTQLMDDSDYESLASYIDNINYNTDNDLLNQLKATNDEAFNEIILAMENPDIYTLEDFVQALKNLDKNHLITLLRLVSSYQEYLPGYDYIAPTQNNIVKHNPTSIQSSGNNDKSSNTSTPSASSSKPVYKQAKSNGYYVDYQVPQYSQYDIYQYFLALYLNGEITYDQLQICLEANGINTDGMVLNEDGSITFFDERSPAPKATKNTDDDSTIDDSETTDNEDTSDEADSTDSTDSTDAEDNTETADTTSDDGSSDTTSTASDSASQEDASE